MAPISRPGSETHPTVHFRAPGRRLSLARMDDISFTGSGRAL